MTLAEQYTLDCLGVLIKRGYWSSAEVTKANALIDKRLSKFPPGKGPVKFPILDLDDMFIEFWNDPWLQSVLKWTVGDHARYDAAFGRQQPCRLGQTANLHGGSFAAFNKCVWLDRGGKIYCGLLAVGIALTAQNPETGGFVYIPGSHKAADVTNGHEIMVNYLRNSFRHQAITCPTLEPGDMLVFPESLVHGASPLSAGVYRRSAYYTFSPGHSAWFQHQEDPQLLSRCRTSAQRRLLRPPAVGTKQNLGDEFSENVKFEATF